MDGLERKAREFLEEAQSTLGDKHPLPTVFAGLMMAYYADETDLQWIDLAMRPWFADSEKKMAVQGREIVMATLWILTAARAAKGQPNRKNGNRKVGE